MWFIKMKQQQLKYRYGNKAIIFTLDMFIAITIFSIAFAISLYYVSQASENKFTKLQMVNAASDLLAVMDYQETLQSLNSTLIENQTNELLPQAYQMRILIETNNNDTIDVGGIASPGIFVASGKRYFTNGTVYGEVNYWIWPRQ